MLLVNCALSRIARLGGSIIENDLTIVGEDNE